MTTQTPEKIGRYEILRQLGRGAMGAVYLARDATLGRLVALKTFRIERGTDPEELALLRRRLLREAQSAGMLSHPNVITIYDVVDDDGGFYIAMEYVEGHSLAERLRQGDPLGVREAMDVLSQIAAALDGLHQRGIVHRDVKPANILIAPDGRVKITDFGVARPNDPTQTQETAVLGTPQYMAPEQIRGEELDARTDVFALAVLAYEMLTGEKPFGGKTVAEVTHAILYGPPRPFSEAAPDLPREVGEVLDRGLAKAPEDRPSSAGELVSAVEAAVRGEQDEPTRRSATRRELDTAATAALHPRRWFGGAGSPEVPRRRRRPRLGLVAGIALLVALAFAAGAAYFAWRGPAPDEIAAQAQRVGYEQLLREGQRRLAENDPQGAAILFATAESLDPRSAEARNLRVQAERHVAEARIAARAAEAREALVQGQYQQAIAIARGLLGPGPGNDEGLAILAEVEAALGEPVTREALARPPDPAVEEARTVVELRLRTSVEKGVVVIYAGTRQILLEPFAFDLRRHLFSRKPDSATLSRLITIPRNERVLRVLVAREGEGAHVREVPVPEASQGRLVLDVSLPGSGEPRVDLHTTG